MGTTHFQPKRAATTIATAASGSRTASGTKYGNVTTLSLLWPITSDSQAIHWPGLIANETAAIPVVTPNATASARHSRRTANHSRPTAGVIFVSRTNAYAPGRRNPTASASAMNRLTFAAFTSD